MKKPNLALFLRYFPLLSAMAHYKKAQFIDDSIAAIIVTIMLIPQSLAYALLAGLPPEMGLYASIIPLVLYAILGTSHALSVGPVAVVSLMTAAALGNAQAKYGINYIEAALTLAFLSGVFMLVLGLLRFGFIANLLSHPVVSGFISASAILIALSQLKHVLGIQAASGTLPETIKYLWHALDKINYITLVMGLLCVLFLWWSRSGLRPVLVRFNLPKSMLMPLVKASPVLAVIFTIALTALLSLNKYGVNIVGDVPKGLPALTFPTLSYEWIKALILPALLISLIGFVESVSVGKTLAGKVRSRIDPNQELIALGAANIGAGISGGFPVTGGFSRSVVNFDAGAATQIASILTAIGILFAALFLTPALYFLPKVTLAATIIVAVLTLVDAAPFMHAWHYSKADFIAIFATFILTLMFGVEIGVLSGVIASIALHLFKTATPHIAEVGLICGTEHFRNVLRHKVKTNDELLMLRPDESLYFINANVLVERIYASIAERTSIKNVVIQCNAVNVIDLSALEALVALNDHLERNDIKLHFSEVKGPVMDKLSKSGFLNHLSGEIFLTQFSAYQTLITNHKVKR